MIVRRLDDNDDWSYGYSKSDYLTSKNAIAQNVKTRLKEYLGDCFFNLGAGIAWDIRLGQTNQEELLKSDTYRIIKDTDGVLGIIEHRVNVHSRRATIQIIVQTFEGPQAIEVVNG